MNNTVYDAAIDVKVNWVAGSAWGNWFAKHWENADVPLAITKFFVVVLEPLAPNDSFP